MTLLKPLLSVCAFCQDVRDPLGRWTYINHRLLDWLEYRLSHGICPDCVRKHFPEFSDRILDRPGASGDPGSPARPRSARDASRAEPPDLTARG